MMMIATIGDTINNVVIENQSKKSWGQQRFFVITPDEDMAQAMTDALIKAIKIIQRNYINPGSTRGPDPYKVLNPFSIQFNGRKGMRPTN